MNRERKTSQHRSLIDSFPRVGDSSTRGLARERSSGGSGSTFPKLTLAPRLDLPIRSRRLELRLPRPGDAPYYLEILTSRAVRELMLTREPLTLPRVRHNIAERRREARAGTRYDLTVVLQSTRRVVGRVALKRVDRKNRQAEIAYWFGPQFWGVGLATEAAWTLCRAGFADLGLHRIAAGVFGFNKRSVALLERLGFRLEGSFRDAVRHNGRWVPELRFGLLRGELTNPLNRLASRPGSPLDAGSV